MKKTILALLCMAICFHCFSAFAQSDAQITVNLKSRPISMVLTEIEGQCGLSFFYSEEVMDPSIKVSLSVFEEPLSKVLEQLFQPLGLTYSIEDKTILLSKAIIANAPEESRPKTPSFVGRVLDLNGEAVYGAAIVSMEGGSYALADMDGYFTVPAKEGEKFKLTCMGFTDLIVSAKLGDDAQTFVLKEDFQMLDELVFVGYGSQRKSDITGAITSIKAEELNKMPTVSVGEMLRGTAAGVQVKMNSAEPGGSSSVLIRGRRSLSADNSPLYIVDGVPMGGMDDINAFDIESMEILKDASSQSIYGARAANGVILITTKRGIEGKVKVSYDGYMSVQGIDRNCEFYNGEEWAAYRKEAYIQAFGTYDEASCFPGIMGEVLKSGEFVNWEELMIHKALQQKHDILVQSGNESTKFVVGLGLYQQDGMVINSGFDKVSARINIDHKISKNLSIGANLNYVQSWKQTADGTFNTFISMPPLAKVYEDDAQTLRKDVTEAGESHYNPLWNINNSEYRTNIVRQLYNVFLDWKIVDGLTYKLNTSMTSRAVDTDTYLGRNHTSCLSAGYLGKATVSRSLNNDYLLENILSYNIDFKSVHHIDATLMQSLNVIDYKSMSINGTDFANDDMSYKAIGSALNYGVPSYGLSNRKMLSFLARARYNYDDRYLFTAAVRVDGSSVFGKNHKFGCFPSVSFAWRINKENFLNNVDWLSNLKLRLSWGQVGNQGVSPYTTLGLTEKYLTEFDKTAIGYLPDTTLSNPELKWETSTSMNAGLDFGFFNGRISGSLELYQTDTDDLLIYKSLSNSTGYVNQLVNLGAVQNKGVELTLNTVPLSIGDFEWMLNFTYSKNVNRIIRIDDRVDENGNPLNDVNNKWFIGQPMNVYYDYAFDGIWQIGDEISNSCMPDANPGDIKVKDVKLDNTINADDRVIFNRDPDWIGTIVSTFEYKGIDLSLELYASVGGYIYNEYLTSFNTGGDMTGKRNGLRRNYWTVNNPSNEAPAPNMTQAPAYIAALGYQDATYFRLRNIQLGYTFPKNVTKALSIQRLRLYATFTNVWTKTEVLGYGPEGNTGAYPEPRTALIGVNLTF